MPNIKPLRDYSEHDVINFFKYSGTLPATAGTFVKIQSGWDSDQVTQLLGPVGASYANTVSERFGVAACVTQTANTGDACIGMLLMDVRELDENGEKLVFNPRKAAEINSVLSGQAVPILTRGLVLFSGVQESSVTAGTKAYVTGAGGLTITGPGTGVDAVGTFLGSKDSKGFVLLKLSITNV